MWPTFLFQMVGVRREFSHAEGHVKSLVTRVLDRRHRTLEDVPAPVFEDSRGPNVLEVRQKQVQLLPKERGDLVRAHEAGESVTSLAKRFNLLQGVQTEPKANRDRCDPGQGRHRHNPPEAHPDPC